MNKPFLLTTPRMPKAAKESLAKAETARENARYWRDAKRHDRAREHEINAKEFEAQAQAIIQLKASKAAAKIERAAVKERLANGTASLKEQLGAMTKPKLLKLAKAINLMAADDSTNFSKMSPEGLRFHMGRGNVYTTTGTIGNAEVLAAIKQL